MGVLTEDLEVKLWSLTWTHPDTDKRREGENNAVAYEEEMKHKNGKGNIGHDRRHVERL